MAGHPPHLADHFDRRGFAVGPGDRDDDIRIWTEEFRSELGEQPPRLGVGKVRRTFDMRLRTGDDSDRAALDRRLDEVLAVEPLALERAEQIAVDDLAMVDGKARDFGIHIDPGEIAKAHRVSVPSCGRTAGPRPDWARGACRDGRRASARFG